MAHEARLNLRMQKELKLLLTDAPPGVSVLPLPLSQGESSSTSSLSTIEARIEGPEGTAYSSGIFTIRVQVPERYPFQPPNVTFVTPIYHPNIDNGGRICLDILNLPPKGAWQPSLNISTVLTSIGLLLSEPNPDDGLMCEVSREYKFNRQAFDQKARSWTEKYAKAGACGRSNDACIIRTSSKTQAEQAQTGSTDPGSDNDGTRKRLCVTREKLSLRAAIEKSDGDDKENAIPIRQLLLPRSQNVHMNSHKIDSPKQAVLSAKNQPGKVLNSEDAHQNKEHPQDLKTIETLIVLDSEDSEDEGDNRLRRSRLSLVRRRGERKTEQSRM